MSTLQLVRVALPLLLLLLLVGVVWSAWRIGVSDGRSGLLAEQAALAAEAARESRALAGAAVERAHGAAAGAIDETYSRLAQEARRVTRSPRAAAPVVQDAAAPAGEQRSAVAAVAPAEVDADRGAVAAAACLDGPAVGVWNDAVAAYAARAGAAGAVSGAVPAAAHAAAGDGGGGAERLGGGVAPVLALRADAGRFAGVDAHAALDPGAEY
jgi:hypothetical protein